MKKSTIVSALVAFIFLSYQAYSQVEIEESAMAMSQGSNNALVFEIPTTDQKIVQSVWEKEIKQYKGKTKFNRNTNEIFTDNAKIKELSGNTVDIYARINGTTLAVWTDLGGAYVSEELDADQYGAVSELIYRFHDALSLHMAEVALKDEEDILKSLNSDLKRLESENDKYMKSIEKAKLLIAENERLVKVNLASQDAKNEEVENQQTKVKAAKEHVASFQSKDSN